GMGIALPGNVPRDRRDAADRGGQRPRPGCARDLEPMNPLFFRCIAACLAAGTAFGASLSLDLTVAAGRHERNDVPVRVPIARGQIGNERIASATLSRADGQLIPAQWTGPGLTSSSAGELHFILPRLRAGESLQLKATLTVYNVTGGHLIEFGSRLRSLSERVRIDGDPQHA